MWATLGGGQRIEVSTPAITVVQDDAETLRTPARDVRAMLAGSSVPWQPAYRMTRSAAVLPAASSADTLVFGVNAIHHSDALAASLAEQPPATNMVVLHQLRSTCLRFLTGDLALRLRELAGADSAAPDPTLSEPDEVLLHWPVPVALPLSVTSVRWLDFDPQTAWRVVLTASRGGRRFPVVVRTAATHPRRVVVCTALLEAGDDAHRALLENMLLYASFGRPEVAVVDREAADYDGVAIARSLRVQGTRAVVVDPGTAPIDLSAWPLRGVQHVVVPGDGTVAGADPQRLRPGAALVRYDAGDRLVIEQSSSDEEWVRLRWATWFAGTEPGSWLDSIFEARAVLRMVAALHAEPSWRSEVGSPAKHVRSVALLLGSRIRGGHCEYTISTTAAAWELNELVGGLAVPAARAHQIEGWLGARLADAGTTIEDRLEIIRALGRRKELDDLWDAAADRAGVTAVAATRLREAAVACYREPGDVPPPAGGGDIARAVADVRASAVVAAQYLDALLAFRDRFPGHRLAEVDEVESAALDTLIDRGTLGRLARGEEAPVMPEEISTEALAMTRYFRGRRSVAAINSRTARVPDQLLPPVIMEANRARQAEAAAYSSGRGLATAMPVLGAIALTAVVVGVADVANVGGVHVSLGVWPPLLFAALLGALVGRRVWVWRTSKRVPVAGKDVAMARVVFGVLTVATALAVVLGAHQLFGWPGAVAAGLAVFAAVFGALALALSSFDLVPIWMAEVVRLLANPEELAKKASDRLRRQPPT
jgi:hypothetical protein